MGEQVGPVFVIRTAPPPPLMTRKQSLKVSWHRESNMAVNLTDLSLPQLEGLKTQLDQVTQE